jgi:type VI protein secretion system component VasF
MQTDLLFTQREEEQPESLSSQNLTLSEIPSTPETAQPEPPSTVEANPAVRVEKKHSGLKIAAIVLAFLAIFALLLSFAWVGYWAYTLNNELNTTQQQLTTLQTEHEKLQADYVALTSKNEKLNSDLALSKSDLEKSNTDLTSTQADLSKSKQNEEKLQTRIDAAGQLMEILYVMSTSDHESDVLKLDRLVTESKDKELMEQWDTFTQSPSEDAIGAFLEYIVSAIRNHLK